MDEKYPDQGAEDKDQKTNAERRGLAASPDGDPRSPAAEPLPAGELPPTGDNRVDAAVAGLSRLRGIPVDEQVAVLEEAYGRLRDILGELSESPDPSDPGQGRR
jgi:hypothetical protein